MARLVLLVFSGSMLWAAEELKTDPSRSEAPAGQATAASGQTNNKPDMETEGTLDWESRAIIGWHQAGASSSESSQHLFFDFFVARPLVQGIVYQSSFDLWGQVRVASAPQQMTIPLSQFAVDFAKELGSVPVNQLAQSAEFLTGFEFRPKWFRWTGTRVRTLGLVGFFGAGGAFSDPATQGRVFRVPAPGSPQWRNFLSTFPAFEDPALRAQAGFVGLMPPDRERFFRQYGGGIRYTSYDLRRKWQSPAMFTATIGQDQAITGGRYTGTVLRFDAFYPLPLGTSERELHFVYLFGTATLAVAKPRQHPPLALELVSAECGPDSPAADAGINCGVKLYQDNVAVFTVPTSRDTYRIGVGIDFISLLSAAKSGFAR